ncbi:carbohydrate ABC transporter permease [Cohnella sp. LGH]|uniref:carbohydrate ABC transporter permease n=1 Tax=Cohnella sp. LGH TaxID=1619153 RepID=UPI001FFDEFC6|nr:carbohydrate ABC transporter permease [Cohnella sp. LGH]
MDKSQAISQPHRGSARAKERLYELAVNLAFILICLVFLAPIILIVIVSFSDERSVVLNGYSYFPDKFSLEAYKFILREPDSMLKSYGVTITTTIIGALTGLLLTALLAYPLSRRDFKARNVVAFYVFFTMLFNGGLVPWYIFYAKYVGIGDTFFALIVPNLLLTGFHVMIMRTFFVNTIPVSILESAEIDGAGEWRIFFQIVLPLSLPVLATIGLFATLGYWNDWFNSLIFINKPDLFSLQYLMTKLLLNIQFLAMNTQNSNMMELLANMPKETVRMAMAIIGAGPIVLAYPFFQRYLIQGLTIGAVKG